MILHRVITLLLFLIVFAQKTPLIADARCEIREFQTTRLKSTGGAGVGAILFEESAFLNPAPLAFYDISSVYYQSMSGDNIKESGDNTTSEETTSSSAIILTDTGGGFKGSFSYIKKEDELDTRKQYGVSVATLMGKTSAFGASVLIKKDTIFKDGAYTKENYEQFLFGVSHFLTEELSFGVSIIDPFRTKPEDTKAIVGFQYTFKNTLSLMLDLGADYKESLGDNYVIRSAAQVKFLDDFYLRFGLFNDKAKEEKGSGIGISWVSVKLSADIAQNTLIKKSIVSSLEQNKVSELTFSLGYRF